MLPYNLPVASTLMSKLVTMVSRRPSGPTSPIHTGSGVNVIANGSVGGGYTEGVGGADGHPKTGGVGVGTVVGAADGPEQPAASDASRSADQQCEAGTSHD